MNYVSWIDSDGQAHDISEMPTEYIKNCIKCIQNSDYENKTKKDAQKDKEHKIFEAWWCYKHAQNYIDAFNFETLYLIFDYPYKYYTFKHFEV